MDSYDIGAAFEAIEDELIESMIRNMKRHRVEEVSQGIQWSQWQVEQLKALEKFKKQNQELFSGKFKEINSTIEDVIKTARQQGNMDQEITILEAIKGGFKGARRQSRGTYGEFFRLNDRKLNALIKATTDDFKKGETAILRQANDQYRQIIYNAQVYANTGAGTYEKAVDMATKDFLSRGITCIEYANGARHTMKDYADMAIRTATKRAYLTGEGEKRQEWGIHTVILNKRGDNPCPKCLPFVGKVLIDDVWSNGSSADGPYPLMSHAIARGLYHPRCKDSHTTYFPGLSTADDTWTQEELDSIEWENRQEAKQQYAERQEEKYDRLAKYSLDEENQKKYGRKADIWRDVRSKTGVIDENEYATQKRVLAKDEIPVTMKLTDDDKDILNKYTSFDFYQINDKLRLGVGLNDLERSMVTRLDSTLKKIPLYEGNLSRSVYFGNQDLVKEYLENFKIGEEICFKEFISTTCDVELYNPDGEVQIYIENAKNGHDITSINKQEMEVLYERNQRFKVNAVVENANKYWVLLEER